MVCWLPNQIRRLMMAAMPKSRWTTSYFRSYVTLHPVADTFFYLSSVLNPLLYNLSSRRFRQVFVQVLRCRLTIQHVNQRAAPPFLATSARSLRPLLRKSFRWNGGEPSTRGEGPLAPQQGSGSGGASNTLSLAEEPGSILKVKADKASETDM